MVHFRTRSTSFRPRHCHCSGYLRPIVRWLRNMKTTFITVCALTSALIAIQPAFAKDKAKGDKESKSKNAPVRVAAVAGKSPAAIKKSPPKEPWAGYTVTIAPSERHIIRTYVH